MKEALEIIGEMPPAFWLVLAFGYAWLDRLSRGYMTGRLRLLGVLSGVAVPIVVLCL